MLTKNLLLLNDFGKTDILFCTISFFEILVGTFFNINDVVLFTYFLFLYYKYKTSPKDLIMYFWLYVFGFLNIIGVYICDSTEVYLFELEQYSRYSNAFSTILFLYICFYCTLKKCNKNDNYIIMNNVDNIVNKLLIKFLLVSGIALEICIFSQIYDKPFFLLMVERLVYISDFLPQWVQSLKSYLPLFIPVAVLYYRYYGKFLSLSYLILMLMIYFFVGDKFGYYFLSFYIFLVSYINSINGDEIRKWIKIGIIIFILLIGVVALQRIILFADDFNGIIAYLNQRLAQEGEVWWAVYGKDEYPGFKLGVFFEDWIAANLGIANQSDSVYGQWRMLLVSSGFSNYAWYRVSVGNPYASTSAASYYYMFRWPGVFLFFILMSWYFSYFINKFRDAICKNKIINGMISIKLILIGYDAFTGSDLYLITYKGVFYLILFYFTYKIKHISINL